MDFLRRLNYPIFVVFSNKYVVTPTKQTAFSFKNSSRNMIKLRLGLQITVKFYTCLKLDILFTHPLKVLDFGIIRHKIGRTVS